MESLSTREAHNFLTALFSGCKALADAHPEQYTYEKTLRPDTPAGHGRSGFILRKLYARGEEQFTLVSSGVSAPKLFDIIGLLEAETGQSARFTAIDERGTSLTVTQPEDRRSIAHLNASFGNGISINWTAVSGITLHCPTKPIFEQLATTFAAKTPSMGRA